MHTAVRIFSVDPLLNLSLTVQVISFEQTNCNYKQSTAQLRQKGMLNLQGKTQDFLNTKRLVDY
eukprot:1132166-Amphidinium_carterae.1